ncbi:MAG: Multidrug export protein AcrE [Stenotrophomonas maltophilia]|nr:MAG: Multidrug export protein AcrE [Stenotrophomonas maltophilia]
MGALGLVLLGCGPAAEPPAAEAAKPVEVVSVTTEALALSSELPGRIEPVRVAEVRARVAGIVLHKRFEEGADVKAGDLLFQIDPAPLKAALARAEGELARSRATRQEAQARVRRYAPLVKIEAVSQQDFDSASADLGNAEAAVQTAQADVDSARLNLGYATVRAPISGRIGRALVTEGALVGQNETTLMARIQQLDPIYADFTQPVADALRLREALKAGSLAAGDSQALSIRVDGTDIQRRGELLFTDVAVDRSTGQISLRGRFANPDAVLLPGMYVRVSTPQGVDDRAILVPQRAVLHGTDGSARVLLVGADGRVEARSVETGAMQDGRWQIRQGLAAGERVIVGGLSGLQPGTRVEVRPLGTAQTAKR